MFLFSDVLKTSTNIRSCAHRHDLIGYNAGFIWSDVLHVLYLGPGCDFVSSSIVRFCRLGVFGAGSLNIQLGRALLEIKSWCRQQQVHVSITALNTKMLQLKRKNGYPSLMCKGADVKLLIAWVAEVATHRTPAEPLLIATACSLASFVYSMDIFPMFMSSNQANILVNHGEHYLIGLLGLRMQAHASGQLLYKIRPKCHAFQCRVLNRNKCGSRLNPKAMSCFHDE